jgi:hypothetical protein
MLSLIMVIDVGRNPGGGVVPDDVRDSAVPVGSWLAAPVPVPDGGLDGRGVAGRVDRLGVLSPPALTGCLPPPPPPPCSSDGTTVGASAAPAMTTTALAAVTRAWFIFRRLARR